MAECDTPDLEMAESLQTPSRTRYVVLAFLCSLAFILYIDRVCIGKAAKDIEQDLGLSHTQMGYIFGAFTIAYGMFEVVTGRWGDRFGSRGVLTRIVIWWSIFTALTGSIWKFSWDLGITIPLGFDRSWSLVFDSFLLMVVVRFLFGAGEAGALPNICRVLGRWFPLSERGFAQGSVICCMQLGGALAPVIATYLIGFAGWRWAFVTFGLCGVVWVTIFYNWFHDDPATHPQVNDAELRHITQGEQGSPAADAHGAIPWKAVLSNRNVWLLGSVVMCGSFSSYMYMFWFPTYLQEGRGVDEETAGWLAGLALGGSTLGSFLGGYFSTAMIRWTGELRWSRRVTGFVAMTLGGVLLAASTWFDSPYIAAGCAALASFAAFSQQANWWQVTSEVSGPHVGAIFGLMNSLGVPGAFLSPIFLGKFADWRSSLGYSGRLQWDPAFFVYAAVLIAGGCCWLLVDPTRPVVEKEEAEKEE